MLTNNHVIENATKITATSVATGRTYPAKVVGYDVTGDVAEIQLQGASGLDPDHGRQFRPRSRPGPRWWPWATPRGQSEIVPATGQVTGLNQTITASDQGGTVSTETLHGMIETNADIVAGDSGGPLADTAGQVLGMDTAGNDVSTPGQQSAAGFAIPIKTATRSPARSPRATPAPRSRSATRPSSGSTSARGRAASPTDPGRAGGAEPGDGFGGGSVARAAASAVVSAARGGGFGGSGNGGTASCYTNDANLSAPSTIASVNSGTLVLGTICGSPAASAGLTAGSVITGVNGQTVGSPTGPHRHPEEVQAGQSDLAHLGHPVRPDQDRHHDPDRRPAPVSR